MQVTKKLISVFILISFLFGIGGGFVGSYLAAQLTNGSDVKEIRTETIIVTDEDTVQAVSAVSPAVVSVLVFQDVAQFSNRTGPNIFPFDDFFEEPFNYNSQGDESPETKRTQVGGGSGFIVTSEGIIVTNRHVVDEEDGFFTVVLQDGREFEATVLGEDPFNDVAVLKIEATDLPTVPLGDSDVISIGQSVIAIGNSLGEYQNSVTKGIVSGVNRRVVASDFGVSEVIEEAIQTDAAINPGNSGGPLINLAGEVIGINTAISRSGQLIGFAIPINTVKHVVESVKEFGRIVRPWLGVRYLLNSDDIAKDWKLSVSSGAIIVEDDSGSSGVIEDSPAAKAGLQTGDVIVKVDNTPIDISHSLGKVIAAYKPGDVIMLEVIRDEETLNITVTLEEFLQ